MVEFYGALLYLCRLATFETELSGMSGKLLEGIRSADQSVELAVHDRPARLADGYYPVPRVNVDHLANPNRQPLRTARRFSTFGGPATRSWF